MMIKWILATLFLSTCLLPQPSLAREMPAEVQAGYPEPALATMLSAAGPPVVLLTTWAANLALGTPYLAEKTRYYALPPDFNRAMMLVSPLGFSAGYFYAGDPARGLLVGLGGTAITAAGFGYLDLVGGQQALNHAPIVIPLMVLGLVGYGWWVAGDVQEVTARKNEQLTTPSGEP